MDAGETVSTTVQKVNQFIAEYVEELYLWTSSVDWTKVKPADEPDSFDFFDKLVYSADRWSMLTDDLHGLSNEFEGVSTTFGHILIFGRFSDSNHLFAIVLYVYPDTPAEEAGVKRGDIFLTINGDNITEENYGDLYYASSLVVGRGILTDEGIAPDDRTFSMKAETLYENPIVKDTVIVKGAHKIGYLCYTDYTMASENALIALFSGYKSQGVTDVVLDLRYNGGGFARTSVLLSSILAPEAVVKRKDVFLTQVRNDAWMAYLKEEKMDVNDYFTDTLSVNMDLKRIFVLTTENTASASESTLVGLDPYMDVVRIGTATHGKYYGGGLFSDEENRDIANWGMYLMIYRFDNQNGITASAGGLTPDIEVEEDYFPLYPFGDERDPLLGAALEVITGQPARTRSDKLPHPYTVLQTERRGALVGKMIQQNQ
jgi:C-terminal processing protease CtpA/Prc